MCVSCEDEGDSGSGNDDDNEGVDDHANISRFLLRVVMMGIIALIEL